MSWIFKVQMNGWSGTTTKPFFFFLKVTVLRLIDQTVYL